MALRFIATTVFVALLVGVVLVAARGGGAASIAEWERENPIVPNRPAPFGMELFFQRVAAPRPERVRLGRWLFYDRRLSADGTVSCATCHKPEFAFSLSRATATGIHGGGGTRKPPTFLNAAVLPPVEEDAGPPALFWDGRARSLEEQVLGPIENPVEMGSTRASMVETLSKIAAYRPYFAEAFGSPAITAERVATAIADYERTRVSGNSAFDRFEYARDRRALSPAARHGREIFFWKGRCAGCHAGSNFTNGKFNNLGIGWDAANDRFADEGRYRVTGQIEDMGRFKVPTLRDVARHPPYMHDGSKRTLREVVEFYNRGGTPNRFQRPPLPKLGLNDADIDALVAFLHSLNGEGFQDTPPITFPR